MLKTVVDGIFNLIPQTDDGTVILEMDRSIQLDGYSCGAHSTFMVLQYFGKARSIERVKESLGTYDWGYTSPTRIIRLLREKGLRVSIVDTIAKIEKAIDGGAPVIAHMDYKRKILRDLNHWIVVNGYSSTHIYVLDPSPMATLGTRVTRAEFRRRWGRYGIGVGKK